MAEHFRQLTSSSNTVTGVSQWLLFSTLGMLHVFKLIFLLKAIEGAQLFFFFLQGIGVRFLALTMSGSRLLSLAYVHILPPPRDAL